MHNFYLLHFCFGTLEYQVILPQLRYTLYIWHFDHSIAFSWSGCILSSIVSCFSSLSVSALFFYLFVFVSVWA